MIYAPAVYLLLASFNPGMQLGLVPPDQFSLTWYAALAGERRLQAALVESILVGAATAVVATPIGLSAALAFRAMARRRGAFFLFVLFAMFVPGTIQGLSLSVMFKVLKVKPSWFTVAVSHVLWALPFAFTVCLVSLAVVRPNMIAAARDLGAGAWRAFRDVTLPLVRTGIVSAAVFSFLLSFNEYSRAFFLVGRTEHAAALHVRGDELGRVADHLRPLRCGVDHLLRAGGDPAPPRAPPPGRRRGGVAAIPAAGFGLRICQSWTSGPLRTREEWWSQAESNRRPLECHSSALPTELWPLQVPGFRFRVPWEKPLLSAVR